jgi:hypothetical protein
MGILKRGLWHHITHRQEEQARAALMRKREHEPEFMRLAA